MHIGMWLSANVMFTSAPFDKHCVNSTVLSSCSAPFDKHCVNSTVLSACSAPFDKHCVNSTVLSSCSHTTATAVGMNL